MDAFTPLVPWFLALICGGLGWWMNDLYQAHKSLREDVAKFKEEVPKTYVCKADFRDDLDEIKGTLREIAREIRGQRVNNNE